MSTIQIMADSTCDLTPELIEANGIRIIPLYVVFDDRTYRDGRDLTTGQLYDRVAELGSLPRTSAPSPADFVEVFQPAVASGCSVVYISISSELSSTYQNACIAAAEFPEGAVQVVDSRNLSTGIGLTVLKAADYVRQGMTSAVELAARLREDTARVEAEFVIDTLDYLHKGGRCSGTQLFIGSLLRIHPVIKVTDGRMIVAEKLRGRMDKAAAGLLDRALEHRDRIDRTRVFVTHSMAPDTAQWLKERLEQELGSANVIVTDAGCVISSHCGPGTVGILLMMKQ
ncbi:DegV family protein [Gorillibacterium sp. sgz5001074]|uniref:DegV family protein n=1 Tax=Gorillibacterium sp. sgz5001074 TaxID=3446695 RepID=UPI003F663F91